MAYIRGNEVFSNSVSRAKRNFEKHYFNNESYVVE